jgi:hypothetical protein
VAKAPCFSFGLVLERATAMAVPTGGCKLTTDDIYYLISAANQSKQFKSKQFKSKQFLSKQFLSKQLIAFFSSKRKQLLPWGFLSFFL